MDLKKSHPQGWLFLYLNNMGVWVRGEIVRCSSCFFAHTSLLRERGVQKEGYGIPIIFLPTTAVAVVPIAIAIGVKWAVVAFNHYGAVAAVANGINQLI